MTITGQDAENGVVALDVSWPEFVLVIHVDECRTATNAPDSYRAPPLPLAR